MLEDIKTEHTDKELKHMQAIYKTAKNGGPFAHNLIGITLQTIAKTNRPLADEIYQDLINAGIY